MYFDTYITPQFECDNSLRRIILTDKLTHGLYSIVYVLNKKQNKLTIYPYSPDISKFCIKFDERIYIPIKLIIQHYLHRQYYINSSVGIVDNISLFDSPRFMAVIRAHLILTKYIARLKARKRAVAIIERYFLRAYYTPDYALCCRRMAAIASAERWALS